ncbi:MAG: hypothetical protein LBV78_19915 [Kitasatospora sp.]|nr:hypothetical protein [Kitasatospora sp.]
MKGGAPRVVWLTLGVDPQLISAHSAAERLNQLGRPCHLVWNPLTGQIVQLIPIVRAGLALGVAGGIGPERAASAAGEYPNGPLAAQPSDGAAGVHTEGRLCVQVGVIGFGRVPFTSGPMTGVEAILDWLDSWQIERRWPVGRPAPFGHAHAAVRSRRLWACGGHFGASQVPCCLAAGPGAIDVERLTGTPIPLARGAVLSREHETQRARSAMMTSMADVHPEAGDQADALAGVG